MSDREAGDEAAGAYYAEVGDRGGPARRSGWRRRIGQFARFEMALAAWEDAGVGRVVDFGCGEADLYGYLRATGREVDYLGVEQRTDAVEQARSRFPDAAVLHADFTDWTGGHPGDLVVAVGAQVDGRSATDPEERRDRIDRLISACARAVGVGWSCIVLDEANASRRVSLATDPAVFGATAPELRAILDGIDGSTSLAPGGIKTDWACYGAGTAASDLPERVERDWLGRAVDAAKRDGAGDLDEAWLWLEAGAYGRAECILDRSDAESDRYAHLRDRLAIERETGP